MRWRAVAVGVCAWLLPAVAAAQWRPGLAKAQRSERGSRQPEQPRFWYGQPILLADGLSYSLLLLTSEYDRVSAQTLPLAIGNYLLTPSLIHLGVGNWAQALADLPLRAGAPFTGAFAGALLSCSTRGQNDCSGGVTGGAIAGMVVATVIDAAFFAYEKPKRAHAGLTPALFLNAEQATLGASGVF